MEHNWELYHIIYNVLKAQIQFGIYRAGERLPTMEDACHLFGVSIRTIRNAYQQLQQEGMITISKKVGVRVSVYYEDADIESHIQSFFINRKDALIDLSQSIRPLLSGVQWLCYQNISPKRLDEIENIAASSEIPRAYKLFLKIQFIYSSLNNRLLMRLILQIYMFFLAPFLSVPDTLKGLEPEQSPLPSMIDLCKKQDWSQLRTAIDTFEEQIAFSLSQFYEKRIYTPVPKIQEPFQWSSYQKTSQRCYSLGMEILISISWGRYPAGSMLPSISRLAEEKHVSAITVRRALSLLNSIGVTKTKNGVGTYVLPPDKIPGYCDFTSPAVKNRLLDFIQSLQILALSCKQVTEITFSSDNGTAIEQCVKRLDMLHHKKRCELTAYSILELITHLAPFSAIRTVYTALFHQLLWGYPIRNMRADQITLNKSYLPHLTFFLDCLEVADSKKFAGELEKLLLSELDFSIEQLVKLGISEAANFSSLYHNRPPL